LFYVIFQKEFELSYSQISWLILINFAAQIFIDFTSVKLISKIGYRISIVFAHVFAAAGLILLGILPRLLSHHFAGLVIPVIIYAIGSGLIEVLVSPIIEGLPLSNKSGEMAFLHSFYCWGQATVVLISTFAIKFIGEGNWIYLPMLWAIIPIINMFAFMKVPI
ncbi:MAG TPA: MFS transporter, partial [Ruminococcaceae bacterium]|nr:MFS transporter [Oscillospiraceae bacterium]